MLKKHHFIAFPIIAFEESLSLTDKDKELCVITDQILLDLAKKQMEKGVYGMINKYESAVKQFNYVISILPGKLHNKKIATMYKD